MVDKARKNGKKTNLVYAIPKPFILDARGIRIYEDLAYSLKNNTLTLTAGNMTNRQYPLSIDPTIVVDTTTDFQYGGNTGGGTGTSNYAGRDNTIDYTSSSQISRGRIDDGGLVELDYTFGDLPASISNFGSAGYNSYLYAVGGANGSGVAQSTVSYSTAIIPNNSGFSAANPILAARSSNATVAYNGYLYSIGGKNSASSAQSDIQFAAILSNGTLGSWNYTHGGINDGTTPSSALSTARYGHGAAVYNGYLYIIGGTNSAGQIISSTEYALIRADGTIGAMVAGSPLATARSDFGLVSYMGYLYAVSGATGVSTNTATVEYAYIGSGGLGSWVTGSSLITARKNAVIFSYNGYIYAYGGFTTVALNQDSTESVEINSAGSLASWRNVPLNWYDGQNHSLYAAGSAVYNGWLYFWGGNNGLANRSEGVSTPIGRLNSYAQHPKISSSVSGVSVGSAFTPTRWERVLLLTMAIFTCRVAALPPAMLVVLIKPIFCALQLIRLEIWERGRLWLAHYFRHALVMRL